VTPDRIKRRLRRREVLECEIPGGFGRWWAKNRSGSVFHFRGEKQARLFAAGHTLYDGRGGQRYVSAPDPDEIAVQFGPCWDNPLAINAKRLPVDDAGAPQGFLAPEAFALRLLAATTLILRRFVTDPHGRSVMVSEENVRLSVSRYGGARVDRLADRNRITNTLGLPRCSGGLFLSVDIGNHGLFLADVIRSLGEEWEIVDQAGPLRLVTSRSTNALGGYTALQPIGPERYAR
jgi:hypothetical protein